VYAAETEKILKMTETLMKSQFPAPGQQNGRRLTQAVERASRVFEQRNLRFTKLRQLVYEELARVHTSIGAYDILDKLAAKGTRLAPISIYRAIDALMEAGVIHRLESRNAFFACRRPEHGFEKGKRPLVLACEKCGSVAEVDSGDIFETIGRMAAAADFKPRVKFVEVSGLCPRCVGDGDET
jgi:Fur family zinc uptake transcriptional regulator